MMKHRTDPLSTMPISYYRETQSEWKVSHPTGSLLTTGQTIPTRHGGKIPVCGSMCSTGETGFEILRCGGLDD